MPTDTFTVAVSGDDADIGATSFGWPPSGGSPDDVNTAIEILAHDAGGGDYVYCVAVCRWDTSSIPDDATITAATFRGHATVVSVVDAESVYVQWYAFDGSAAAADYDNTLTVANGTAHGGTLVTAITQDVDNDLALLNPAANINKSGYTGLRLFFDADVLPTGLNSLEWASFDHATLTPPRLLVTYSGEEPPVVTIPQLGVFDPHLNPQAWF